MTAVDFQTYPSTNVSNPELVLVDLSKHLKAKREEGTIVQAILNPENVDKKKRARLHSTNKVAPTLSKQQNDDDFLALVKMMRAILEMQSILEKNMGNKQIYQASIGKSFANHAIAEEKYVVKELAKIAREKREAHSWWHKAFGWALAAIAVALASLTAGLGAALAVVAMTALTMSGAMNEGFLGNLNNSLVGKIGVFFVMTLLSGGVAGAIDGGLAAAGETAAEEAAEAGADAGANKAVTSAKTAAIAGGAMTAGSNNLLGTVFYDTYRVLGGKASKKAQEICNIAGMIATVLLALFAMKGTMYSVDGASSKAIQKTIVALNALLCFAAMGTATFEILTGVTSLEMSKDMKKYAKALSAFDLLKDLANLNAERAKESQEDVRRQTGAFEQETQTFSVMTMPYRAIAQVLA